MNGDMPRNLLTAEQASVEVRVSAERLRELAEAQLAPHWRLDGGEPLFQKSELRTWLANHYLRRFEAVKSFFSLTVVACAEPVQFEDRPPALVHLETLRELPMPVGSGIYFLCAGPEVVYVGQSVQVSTRVGQHLKDKKFDRMFFLPCPRTQLDRLESEFIHALRPTLNGKQFDGVMCAPLSQSAIAACAA